jgi:hypothetical protein
MNTTTYTLVLGLIFAKAQNKFQDPAKRRRVIVDLINAEAWTVLGADPGERFEVVLPDNAQDQPAARPAGCFSPATPCACAGHCTGS